MEITLIPIERIVEDTGQPRSVQDEESLQELAASIRQHGILNPITVAPLHNVGMYRIVTGERRWRAAKLAGLEAIPCIVRELEPDEVRIQQLVENMQRQDLQPLDRARGILALQELTGASVRDVASILGLSERMVRNLLDLLDLPRDIGERLVSSPGRPADGRLTEKHARALKHLADEPDLQRRIAERVEREGLSSAETASMVRAIRENPELSEEILTAPPEAFAGYLKAMGRFLEEHQAEMRRQEAARNALEAISGCVAVIEAVDVSELDTSGLQQAADALRTLEQAVSTLGERLREAMESANA